MADLAIKSSAIYFIVAIILILFVGGALIWWVRKLNAEAERLSQTVSKIIENSRLMTPPLAAPAVR
jgi:hypothetical protein